MPELSRPSVCSQVWECVGLVSVQLYHWIQTGQWRTQLWWWRFFNKTLTINSQSLCRNTHRASHGHFHTQMWTNVRPVRAVKSVLTFTGLISATVAVVTSSVTLMESPVRVRASNSTILFIRFQNFLFMVFIVIIINESVISLSVFRHRWMCFAHRWTHLLVSMPQHPGEFPLHLSRERVHARPQHPQLPRSENTTLEV